MNNKNIKNFFTYIKKLMLFTSQLISLTIFITFCSPYPNLDLKDEYLLLALLLSKPENTKPQYNHPKELLGHWSGSLSYSEDYCYSYYSLSFYNDNYAWLQKCRFHDPFPTIQPCYYYMDYSYGDSGCNYYDWDVQGSSICTKLHDNPYSNWQCYEYSIKDNILTWNSSKYRKF